MSANILLTIAVGTVFMVASPVQAATDPADACKEAKAKTTGKKAADLLKALGKNLKKFDPPKLSSAVSKAQSKMTKGFTKAESKGGCLTTGDVGVMEAKADAFVNDAASLIINGQECGNNIQEGLEQCDGTDSLLCQFGCKSDCTCAVCGDDTTEGTEECDGTDDGACVGLCQINCQCPTPTCANGVLEAGEECDPPCSTGGACGGGEICGVDCACVPDVACTCGSPEPTTLEYASLPVSPPAVCGEVRNAADMHLLDLACGESVFGGGSLGVSPNQPVHIGTPTVYAVECCYGNTLALRGTTPAETGGTDRYCSITGCSQGGPNPVVMPTIPFSTCVVERYDEDMTGWADCATGEVSFREIIRSSIFLTGDGLPERCNGGPNPGGFCQDDSDCAPGGTCDPDPVGQSCPICNPSTNLCNGGPNDGLPCTPMTPDTGQPQYPTTYDCPPAPEDYFGGTLLPHEFTTTVRSVSSPNGHFCGYCRDVANESTACFEGDARIICPDSALGPCKPQMGQTAECGTPTPCETDADCTPPYEACQQNHPGALNQPGGRTIEMTGGSPAGDLTDRLPHDATIVTLDCIPPTFITYQDQTASFPGPDTVSTAGPMQLKP